MNQATRESVRRRAAHRCEYCYLPDSVTHAVFQVDHIIAQQHLADDSLLNLAWSCSRCNCYKGPNLSSVDPTSGEIVNLFHPRQQIWNEHFQLQEALIVGLTPTGRATSRLLEMNDLHRVSLREWLIEEGEFL